MVVRSEVHSWLWAMEGTCCLSRPMCEKQLEKRLAKQLLFVCLSELPSKRLANPEFGYCCRRGRRHPRCAAVRMIDKRGASATCYGAEFARGASEGDA